MSFDLVGFPSKNTAKLVENILINGTQIKKNNQLDSYTLDETSEINNNFVSGLSSGTNTGGSDIFSTHIGQSQQKKQQRNFNEISVRSSKLVPGVDFNIDYFLREPISDANEIVEGVWIGGEESGCDQTFLRKERIQTVVNVSDADDYIHKKGIQYIHTPFVNSLEYIDALVTFMYESRLKGHILIHCESGDQYSATIVVAYIMKVYGKTMYDSIKIVQTFRTTSLRPCVTFVDLLINYSNQYIKKKQKMRINTQRGFNK
jgi:hypothetical protein